MRKNFALSLSMGLLVSGMLLAQYPNQSTLTLEEIMKGEDFIGYAPVNPFWSLGGDTLYFYQMEPQSPRSKLKAFVPDTEELLDVDSLRLKVKNFNRLLDVSDPRKQVFKSEGQLYLFDPVIPDITLLHERAEDIQHYSYNSDAGAIYYMHGLEAYAWDLNTSAQRFLAGFKQEDTPKEASYPDSWIAKEELSLFQYLSDKKEKNEALQNLRKTDEEEKGRQRKWQYLGKGKQVYCAGLSPQGSHVFLVHYERNASESTEVPEWIRADGHVKMMNARPKVGVERKGNKVLIYNITKQDTVWVDYSALPGVYDKPDFMKEYHKGEEAYKTKYDKPKGVRFQSLIFSRDGRYAVMEFFSLDNKDRWLLAFDMQKEVFKTISHQHDEAWIAGPGIRSWGADLKFGFWGDTHQVFYQSEESGFSHLYLYDLKTDTQKALTAGSYEVRDFQFSSNGKDVYLMLNKADYGVYHWYRLDVEAMKWTQLTFKDGKWDLVMDIKERAFAALYSQATNPAELYYLNEQEIWKPLTKSTTDSFQSYAWREPEYVKFKAADGERVPARLYRANAEAANGAAVIFVHGAGYLQNAHKHWSTYFREYMFHNFLADNGYTVLDIDYRGSAGYGRDWRTAIYRHMGGLDLSDHVDGARFLVDSLGIDAGRIGIYGGSYGGFITLMALFKHPEVFRCGAALRSVTDWAHYNDGYTANILNTPEQDPIAYRRSSPIYFAEGLQGPLLILHGMVDVNVQFQDVVRLAQRLIELEKDDWEMALYPVEDHGFTEYKSWLDEYKRIYKLFSTHLVGGNHAE